jgi:hypothetical protein
MLADITLRRGLETSLADLPSLRDWYPIGMDADSESEPAVWWRYLGQRRLTAAFFEDSFVGQAAADKRVCRTPLAALDDLPEAVAPSAFIFHVSRCGSTLLTQLLATLPRCIVASEPPVLDAFFRLHQLKPQHSGGAHTLRQLMAALGQRRSPNESHFFVKFDSWHLPWMAWLRSVFPETPCLLLYREPAEVLASHRRQRGAHMVPGLVDLSALQLDLSGLAPGDLDGYAARVLAGVFRAALAHCRGEASGGQALTLLNYSQLPAALRTELLEQWGLKCSTDELAAMQLRAKSHAKNPSVKFLGDTTLAAVDSQIVTAALAEARADYVHLEQLRMVQTRAG